MPERVVISQNSEFQTEFWALDPEAPESSELHAVKHIEDLTPYGMLLSSLGSCTAIIVHTYAQHHEIELDEVELVIDYQRIFKDDCEHCEEISKYEEQIKIDISFKGNLTPQENEKLYKVSLQCPIHKMLKNGIGVKTQLAKTKDTYSVQS